MRDTQMATRVTDGARRERHEERLPAKPERMVFHGLVIFGRQNGSVDRPGTRNVTLEFAWTTEVFLLFFKAQLMQCIELVSILN